MKKFVALLFFYTCFINAQKQEITLEDIWAKGTFSTQYMTALNSMSHGDFYSVLNFDRKNQSTSVDKYSYKTLEKVATLVDSKDLPDLKSFDNYTFSDDENLLILGTETKQIYRHSSLGKFYVYNIATKQLNLVSDALVQEPTLSPDGKKVAYVYQNNLFVKDLDTNIATQITTDGKKNSIINGITDWVYEEEFAFVRAFQWSGNSDKIAFMRFDETDVPEFTMMKYGESLYPEKETFKYPKAGENNSKLSLHLYSVNTQKTSAINLGTLDQYYIPRMAFTKEADVLCVTTLNRHQNNLNLIFVDTNTLKSRLVLNETATTYIDITNNLTFLKDNSFIWTSEKDGYNHIYHYNKNGKLIKQITSGDWEVTGYYGYNPENKQIYYQSVEDGSINRTVYTIALNGKNKKRLGRNSGSNGAAFSNSFNYYINTFSDAGTPYIFTLNDAKTGKVLKEVKNNNALSETLQTYNTSPKEFFTLKTKNGDFNAWMIKPSNFDPNKKYPLFMYQYSGPGSQSVSNRWGGSNDYWYQMLAQQGYIVACVDGRGTGFKGADFKKVTYKELGKYEIEDQIEAAKELGGLAYIDENNVGIWGWSYGGYMSSLAITKGADTFKMAIAVAPVTSWRFYDTVYTERYMQTPQENPSGYDDNSPINFTDQIKGKYLLVHGSGDDNVHYQNSMRMIKSLVGSGIQFDQAVYPDKNHGIYGRYEGKGNVRLNLYKKMTTFINQNLEKTQDQPQINKLKN